MRARGLTIIMGLLAGLLLATLLPAAAGARPDGRPDARQDGRLIEEAPVAARKRSPLPVLWGRSFGDPSVAATPWGYVAVATGWGVPMSTAYDAGGPWTDRGTALVRLPAWALPEAIWAADLERINRRWVLYYSARVNGLGAGGRCIGVAVSSSPFGGYYPLGDRPLVCPKRARTPRAGDTVRKRGRGMPRTGLIDPSIFRDRGGRLHLLYKTQGFQSSIRMVQLNRQGLRVSKRARSRKLVRSSGTVENPVLVRREKTYYLFTSQGAYGGCRYRTEWRRSDQLGRWKQARPRVLLNRRKTGGVCGPGGADVVHEPGLGQTTIFFHGWVCYRTQLPCNRSFHYQDPFGPASNRAMYAARLGFKGGKPRIKRYLKPG